MIRKVSGFHLLFQRRPFSSSLRQPPNDIPHLQVIRASLAGLLDSSPPRSQPKPALEVLTHAAEVSDGALRALLNARETPTIALDLTRSLNAVALDPIAMVLGAFPTREYRLTGWPQSGKTTLALLASRRRRLVVKTPTNTAKKSFNYRLIQPGPTFTWKDYEIQTESHLADMRPIRVWDPPSEHDIVHPELQAAGCLPLGDSLEPSKALEILLDAMHRHSDISKRNPAYFRTLGVTERLSSAEAFLNAVGDGVSLIELITACQRGQHGKLLFGNIHPKDDDDLIQLHRGETVVGYNQSALELLEGSRKERVAQSSKNNKKAEQNKQHRNVHVKRPEYPKDVTPILQFPEHRRCFHCMVCAGFVRRDAGQHIYGCAHTKVVTQRYEFILAYFTRMMEAFGNGSHVKYLMKDSLACTLMRKHKLRSRAAAYKKFKGIPEFPMPNEKRPPMLRSDKPIPYVPRCLRMGIGRPSCYDTHAVRLLDKIPNYQARAEQVELRKEL